MEVHKVVIVEGNYMLNYDDPLWSPLRDLFDEKVLLTLCASLRSQSKQFTSYDYLYSGTFHVNLWKCRGAVL